VATTWVRFRALELCLDRVTEHLDGEDPAYPFVRTTLAELRSDIEMFAAELEELGEPVELREPEPEEVDAIAAYLGPEEEWPE